MAFVQIIEWRSTKADEMRSLAEEWEKATAGKSKARRRVLCKDRDNADTYVNFVFFDSYEEAMENSNMPETADFSQRMAALADGPPKFRNLDVVEDKTL